MLYQLHHYRTRRSRRWSWRKMLSFIVTTSVFLWLVIVYIFFQVAFGG